MLFRGTLEWREGEKEDSPKQDIGEMNKEDDRKQASGKRPGW